MSKLQDTATPVWWTGIERSITRARLESHVEADVCIVGAGLTGLWTAYYLKRHDPSIRVVVLEGRHVGFGASGRNGGWLTNSVTGGVQQYVAKHGRSGAQRQLIAMNDSIDEVIDVAAAEGIDADISRGGELSVARNPAQLARVVEDVANAKAWSGTDSVFLGPDELSSRLRVSGALGALWHPHCATLQPAKLVTGLANSVEKLGAVIHEDSLVEEIAPGTVRTRHGSVKAGVIIRATEGFTARIPGQKRTWLPMNSSMIATAPIDPAIWDEIGWKDGSSLGDAAHMYIYAQRTADDRIAIGGRGVPYTFASNFDPDGVTPQTTIDTLETVLHSFFPAVRGVEIQHAWSGVLGVPRDWSATVTYDQTTGLGYAGGYVGTGVTSTNLAGRTLADLIGGRRTELTSLPWVDHTTRRWETEPLRWLGVNSIYAAYRAADRAEQSGRARTSSWARVANLASGRK